MFDLSDTFASRCRWYERLYLSAALKHPYEAIDAAINCHITIRSFAFAEHRTMFRWVCEAAESGDVHTLESFRELNQTSLFPVHPVNVLSFWWLEIVPTGLESWAGRIRDLEITKSRIDRLDRLAARMLERCVT